VQNRIDPEHETVHASRNVEVPAGSHGLPWTHAELVNRELVGFLA
jgi:pimeloyl-ACP methyl ester carboxylesterase